MEDNLIMEAIEIAKMNRNNFSTTVLQRNLKIGVIKCNKLMEVLEDKGIVSEYDSKENRRKVLI